MRRTRDRKIVVYIATSADGYIARPDGSVDWLDRPRPPGNYGMGEFLRSIDAVLWGRKTYEKAFGTSGKGTRSGSKIANYVFSRDPRFAPARGFHLVREGVAEFARRLRAAPGKDVWMMGGGGLIASFLDEGEIDEFRIHVVPTLIGEGIPLIAPRHRTVPLRLLSVKRFPDGVARLHYAVPRKGEATGRSRGARS
ncbi:MAG TPA: dihydrofolate reductase family protein [Planctomycetota bacterium]|nr:dihydrofolate reductase family protein [Planctomycetota bacterium]